jgi:hypothetical protein
MFVTNHAEILMAGGTVAALVVFYLRRWLLRRSVRVDPAEGRHRATAGDATDSVEHPWRVNSPRSGVAEATQERVR